MNSKQLHRVTPIPRDRYIPACGADACEQGRIPCPCPYACQISEERDGHGPDDAVFNKRLWLSLLAYFIVILLALWAVAR